MVFNYWLKQKFQRIIQYSKGSTDFYTGEGNIKYTYNNGLMAKDPETAAMNFLRALEKLPGFVKQEQEKIAEIQKDLPILQEVVNGTWSKESRLSELKTELAAVERKIQLSITPETKQDASEQAEKQKEAPKVQESIIRTKGVHFLVAYYNSRYFSSFSSIFFISASHRLSRNFVRFILRAFSSINVW
jgi:hypothetical protein